MSCEIEAFVAAWMRDNVHVLEEITHLVGDDPSTPYGAALAAYLDVATPWGPRASGSEARSPRDRP